MAGGTPRLTVVVVTYNSAPHVEGCLSSLARAAEGFQTWVRIVDNASGDRTAEIAEKVAHTLQRPSLRFELVRADSNLGFTRAMNLALAGTEAEFFLWLNPDVRVEQDCLRILRDVLEKDPRCGAVAPQLRNPDGTVQPSCRRFPRHRDLFFELFGLSRLFPRSPFFAAWKMGDFDHRHPALVDQPQGACLLMRGEAVRDVGPLDERFVMFFSDVDYCRRLYQAGWHIRFEPAARATHEKGASVRQNRRAMIRLSHADFARYFDKWYPSVAYRPVNLLARVALQAALPFRLLTLPSGR
ncbi:MAG: glycosyltransferase family 2 protein [candidate division KSB1 bacterium]|nr:glycosyltransferase family 2 protein [candidate division KSB1 bacterium]